MLEWVEAAIATVVVFLLLYLVMRGELERARAMSEKTAATEPSGASPSAPLLDDPDAIDENAKPVTVNTRPSSQRLKAAEKKKDGDEEKREEKTESKEEAAPAPAGAKVLPKLEYEEDEDVEPTKMGERKTGKAAGPVPVMKIVYDSDAATEEPTQPGALILVSATAQTDRGARRKRNEDSLLVMQDEGIYVVADGMGGYRGGEIASQTAVSTIEKAFKDGVLEGEPHDNIPKRASDLVRAVQMANEAIMARAEEQKELAGMGTTVCAARFSVNKQRLYIAHVGDSRMYRARDGKLAQMTSDHTMEASFGVTGEGAAHLSRAVGVWPVVPVDIILGKPVPGDVYLICSDGLTKMLDDDEIAKIVLDKARPAELVERLVAGANASGGKDNITVILIRVYPSTGADPSA